MIEKKELAAISAVMAIVSEEAPPAFVERSIPNLPTAWQSWGPRQTMQYRDITQRRIIKRVR